MTVDPDMDDKNNGGGQLLDPATSTLLHRATSAYTIVVDYEWATEGLGIRWLLEDIQEIRYQGRHLRDMVSQVRTWNQRSRTMAIDDRDGSLNRLVSEVKELCKKVLASIDRTENLNAYAVRPIRLHRSPEKVPRDPSVPRGPRLR